MSIHDKNGTRNANPEAVSISKGFVLVVILRVLAYGPQSKISRPATLYPANRRHRDNRPWPQQISAPSRSCDAIIGDDWGEFLLHILLRYVLNINIEMLKHICDF